MRRLNVAYSSLSGNNHLQCVADTHAFLWHLTKDRRLGVLARRHLEATDHGEAITIVPTIVLAELNYIIEKRSLSLDFSEIVEDFQKAIMYRAYPLDLDVLEQTSTLTRINVNDIHDRIIVATAKISNCPLLTKDEAIKQSRYVDVIW